MSRVVRAQPDLFAPRREPAPPRPVEPPPLEELCALLARLRVAEVLPWPDLTTAMAAELRVIHLGKQAGAEGAKLASAILDETERLLSAQDRESERLSAIAWANRT